MSSGTLPLGTYHRTQSLGAGTFGSVLTVYNDDGQEFAMKLFLPDEDDEVEDETLEVGALKEISVLRLLREQNGHTNIVPMADVRGAEGYEEDEDEVGAGTGGCLGMTMPMYHLGSLDKAIQDKALIQSKAAKVNITHGLLSAICYLHDNGIMHRDVKADNIMLTEDANGCIKPVLIDFSLAKVVNGTMYGEPDNLFPNLDDDEPATHTGQCGTAGYVAPEVQNCEPYGLSADIWSVGVVLLELCQKETLAAVKNTQAEKLIQAGLAKLPLDKPLPSLIRHFLKKDPSERWTARQALELSTSLFSSAKEPVPPLRIISIKEALPFDADEHDIGEENVAPSKNYGGKQKNYKKKVDPVVERRQKKIKQLCNELDCKHPLTVQAALCYCQQMLQLDEELDDLSSSQTMLDCVVLARKFFEVEMLDLTEICADYKSFSDWDLDNYRENETTILMLMDHCLYPRELHGI